VAQVETISEDSPRLNERPVLNNLAVRLSRDGEGKGSEGVEVLQMSSENLHTLSIAEK
jgi:hypothetical protein